MADTPNLPESSAVPVGNSSPQAKKTKSAVSKKPRVKPSHPPTSDMVNNAIKSLKERGGSSLQAIKKYLSSNYKIDAEKLAPFIKKYLKSAVSSGTLIQTKGKGASGSFKLSPSTLKSKTETANSSIQKQAKKNVKKTLSGDEKKIKPKSSVNKKKPSEKKKSTSNKIQKKTSDKKKLSTNAKIVKKSSVSKIKKPSGLSKTTSVKSSKSVNTPKKPKSPKPKKTVGDKKKVVPVKKQSTASKKN